LGDLEASPFLVPQQTAKVDLTLFVMEKPEGLRVTFEYSTDLFDAATIVRALEYFENLLEGVTASPDRRLSEISLLGAAERQRNLVDLNDTSRKYPDVCMHDLVAQRAELQPDAVALIVAFHFGDSPDTVHPAVDGFKSGCEELRDDPHVLVHIGLGGQTEYIGVVDDFAVVAIDGSHTSRRVDSAMFVSDDRNPDSCATDDDTGSIVNQCKGADSRTDVDVIVQLGLRVSRIDGMSDALQLGF
jgi:hypothetical protein